MTASCAPRGAPPRPPERPSASCSLVGILLLAQVLLLPTSSDACGDPPRFSSMMLSGVPQPSYSPGERVDYKCRPGYKLIVPPLATTAICQLDNTWSALQEACTRKLCPQLGDPNNGQVVYVNGTDFGSQARFVCDEGYYLLGAKTLYCEISENTVAWSDDSPQCEKSLCQPPRQIPNGSYTNSHKDTFEYNEVVTYSCDPSSGPDPYSLVGERRLVCSGQNVWSSDPPECKVVKCPYPTLKNGRLVSGFGTKHYYEAMVVFECLPSFYLKGNNTVVCGANSMWDPEVPTCIKALTSPSTKPTISSVSGVKPTHPTTSPVSSHPGHPIPSDDSPPNDVKVQNLGIIWLLITLHYETLEFYMEISYFIIREETTCHKWVIIDTCTHFNSADTMTNVTSGMCRHIDNTVSKGCLKLGFEYSEATFSNAMVIYGGLLVVIVLTVLVGVAVVGTCIYKVLHIRKSG